MYASQNGPCNAGNAGRGNSLGLGQRAQGVVAIKLPLSCHLVADAAKKKPWIFDAAKKKHWRFAAPTLWTTTSLRKIGAFCRTNLLLFIFGMYHHLKFCKYTALNPHSST
jgi:hypothetical protein